MRSIGNSSGFLTRREGDIYNSYNGDSAVQKEEKMDNKDYYQLHAIDMQASTDPTDEYPLWFDLYYYGNGVDLANMKEVNIEFTVADAKRMIKLLEAGIGLVQAGHDFSMYN